MKKIIIALLLVSLFVLPITVFAQTEVDITLDEAIANVLNWLYSILMSVAIIFLIYGAFLFVTASGNEEQVGKGKQIILWALIGVIVALLANSAVNWVRGIFAT